jgi:EmrB/QacA subfamily drug resistance transporter
MTEEVSLSGRVDPAAGAGRAQSAVDLSTADPRRWLAAAVMLAAVFMDLLDSTIVNVAIPSIQQHLGARYSAIQWITAGYALAFALLLITGGRLGDIIGRKRSFQLGVAGFTFASLLCGVAPNPAFLAGSRVLQGAAAAIMVPQVIAIIHATFPAEERPKAYGIFGAMAGVAAVAGPILGGVLIDWDLFGLGWRTIFLINVPVGVLGLAAGARLIGESRSSHALRLDLVGVAVSTAGLLLFFYPLVQGPDLGWPAWGFASMAASVLVLVGFVRHQRYKTRKDGSPLVVLSLFRARSFVAGLGVQLGFYVAVGLFFLSWNVYLQAGLGFTALRAGLTALAFAAGAFISSALAVAVLVGRFGRLVLVGGVAVQLAGVAAMLVVVGRYGIGIGSWHMVAPLMVVGIGFGLIASPLPAVVLDEVPVQDSGSASGLTNTVMQLGVATGVALVSLAFLAPLAAAAATNADRVTPGLRQELNAAGLPAERVDVVTAAFHACTVERVQQKDPTELPASCARLDDASREPAVASVLAAHGREAAAASFVSSFRVSLFSILGILVVVLALTFGLPRGLRTDQTAGAAH